MEAEKETDCYRTPRWMIEWVEDRYDPIGHDAAASKSNSVAETYFSRDHSALDRPWPVGGLVWCNPPYSLQSKFIDKARRENAIGVRSVLLVSSFLSDRWWLDVDRSARDIWFLCGRVSFLHPTADCYMRANRNGSILIYFPGMLASAPTLARKYFLDTRGDMGQPRAGGKG